MMCSDKIHYNTIRKSLGKRLWALLLLLNCCFQAHSQVPMEKADSLRIEALKKKLSILKGRPRVDCLNDIARELIYLQWSPNKPEYDYAKQAYVEASKIDYKYGIAFSLIRNGTIKSHEAIDSIKHAIAIGESLQNNEIIGWGYLRLGDEYYDLDQLSLVKSCWEKALYHLEKAGDTEGIADLALGLCEIYNKEGKYEKAFPYCEKALLASKQKRTHNISYGHATVYSVLDAISRIYDEAGDYRSALNCLQEASAYGKQNNYYDLYEDVSIGKLYTKMGNYDSAYYHLKKAVGFNPGNIWPGIFIGENYLASHQYDKAMKIFTIYEGLKEVQKKYSWFGLDFGRLYDGLGSHDKALLFTKEALATAKQPREKLNAYILLSGIYHRLGKDDSAYLYLDKYTSFKDSVSNKQFFFRLNENLNRFQRQAQDQKKATQLALLQKDNLLNAQLLKEQILLKDQKDAAILLLDKDKKIIAQQLQEESFLKDQKEARIALLNRDNRIKQQQLQQSSLLRNFLLGGLVLILLVSFFIFRTLLLKRKNESLKRERTENELKLQQMENEKKHTQMQQQATELEMQALRAQMNPHFIFNCLSSINKYILKNETESASDYLTRFSRLIRMVLINSQKSLITLEEELDMLRLYLDMERLRFNNVFDYNITFVNTIEPGAVFIPPLLLQPFCENAIWHGLMHKNDHGKLDIALRIQDDMLYCTITDNGVGREKAAELKSKSSKREKSLGLKITNNRLALLNNRNREDSYFEMNDIYDEDGNIGGTQVDIRIRLSDLVDNLNT